MVTKLKMFCANSDDQLAKFKNLNDALTAYDVYVPIELNDALTAYGVYVPIELNDALTAYDVYVPIELNDALTAYDVYVPIELNDALTAYDVYVPIELNDALTAYDVYVPIELKKYGDFGNSSGRFSHLLFKSKDQGFPFILRDMDIFHYSIPSTRPHGAVHFIWKQNKNDGDG